MIYRVGSRWLVRLAAGALLLVQLACGQRPIPVEMQPARRAGAGRIVVIRSNEQTVFDGPLRAFAAGVEASVVVFSAVHDGWERHLVAAVKASKPDLLFVLGTKAALLARDHFSNVPVLFAMVVNHARHHLIAHPNIMGVALEPAPVTEFAQFKMVVPHLRRVLAFYVPSSSGDLVARAREQLRKLAVDLLAVPVKGPADVGESYEANATRAQAVWLLNDPILMNRQTFALLRDRTQHDRLPFLCSLSERFAELGSLASVSVDFTSLGSQAAAMARQVMGMGVKVSDIGVQPPIGAHLVVNLDTARHLGLKIPADIVPFISRFVGSPSPPSA